jgi:CBS domain-containing protein
VDAEPPTGTFLYLSALLGRPVRDAASGRRLGALREIACAGPGPFPRATRLVARPSPFAPFIEIPWSAVRSAGEEGFTADGAAAAPLAGPPEPREGEVLVDGDVLDQQVVDTDGAMVVRVNDVQFFLHGPDLYLAHVDIGARGLLRRLGFEGLVDRVLRLLADVRLKENLVPWKHLHLLPSGVEGAVQGASVKLDVSRGRLEDLLPADVAELLGTLDVRTRERVFAGLPTRAAAEALAAADAGVAQEMLGAVGEDRAANLLEAMDPGAAAEVVRDMGRPEAEALLDAMDPEAAETVRALATHPEETAGGLMTTRYVVAEPSWTALRALQEVRARAGEIEVFQYLYVLSPEGRLLGVVSLKELFRAAPRVTLRRIQRDNAVALLVDTPRREVERVFRKYGFRAIPILDDEGRMQGVVRFRRILEGMESRP